jgi:hypothetical protein
MICSAFRKIGKEVKLPLMDTHRARRGRAILATPLEIKENYDC